MLVCFENCSELSMFDDMAGRQLCMLLLGLSLSKWHVLRELLLCAGLIALCCVCYRYAVDTRRLHASLTRCVFFFAFFFVILTRRSRCVRSYTTPPPEEVEL